MSQLFDFAEAHPHLMTVLATLSVLMFLGSLVVIPWMLAQMPADYLVREHPRPNGDNSRWYLWILRKFLKNLLGVVLALAGFALMPLPGQGLLTMLVGLSLVDFPGKRKIELRILGRPRILRAVNWLRRRHGKPPLILPPQKRLTHSPTATTA